jgi:class 3 adenylate cyclase
MEDADFRLLVVDDNEMNRDILSRRLRKKKYTVDVAEDGAEALKMIEENPYHLILLDIMMPGIDGLEVLEQVREKHTMAELPVIMVTAKDSSEDVVNALKLGANDYVTKPIDFPVALARTRTHLALKKMQLDLEARNEFIRTIFGRYLTDEVVNSILESPEGLAFGGEKRKVTILMSDLRGFSAVSERLPPEKVVTMLNVYLGKMAEIITKYQGTIDEFIGDAVLAIFGAPIWREDDATRAVACAIEMQRAMDEVNAHNRSLGLPNIEMGIGVNTGEVVVGNIGSDRRAKYGVVGSAVNLAGRIESYTVGGQVLIAGATGEEMSDILEVGQTLSMTPKGMTESFSLLEVSGLGGDYGLKMPELDDTMYALSPPIAVSYTALDGKYAVGDSAEGTLTHLSSNGAVLKCAQQLDRALNLKMILEELKDSGDVYAKCMGESEAGGHTIRFTARPPAVEERLAERYEALRG